MGYELQISQVGEAEYPLMEALRQTIFTQCGHLTSSSLVDDLRGKEDIHALIAHLEGNPVGYKVGHRDRQGVFYSKSGGVLREYRREGLATRMAEMQQAFARSRGYQTIYFNTFNRFRDMLRLGLKSGFAPIGAEARLRGDLSFKMTKDLGAPNAPARAATALAPVHVESVGPTYHGLIAELSNNSPRPVTEREVELWSVARDFTAWIAFIDRQPVGFLCGGGGIDRRAFIWHRGGVLPEHRGKGVATALANHAVDAAASMKYRCTEFSVDHQDRAALLLGLKLEFDFQGIFRDPVSARLNMVLARQDPG
jgi:GNAT superfamily N-acetyltransferase